MYKFSVKILYNLSSFLKMLWRTGLKTVSWDQNVLNAIGTFSTHNWENTSIFDIGNGAEFQPKFEGSDCSVIRDSSDSKPHFYDLVLTTVKIKFWTSNWITRMVEVYQISTGNVFFFKYSILKAELT